jgi:hypothetical protein
MCRFNYYIEKTGPPSDAIGVVNKDIHLGE